MQEQRATVLNEPVVRAALKQAWRDSCPGLRGGHEEGGFVLRDREGNLSVVRWVKGGQNTIALPPHPDCKIGGNSIVATFHTHPNTGGDFLQEPSETDKRAVGDDPDLKGPEYEGEFVVSQQIVYLITPTGQVREMGVTTEFL
jgi:hypothetical protein